MGGYIFNAMPAKTAAGKKLKKKKILKAKSSQTHSTSNGLLKATIPKIKIPHDTKASAIAAQ